MRKAVPLFCALALASCDQPPAREVAAAEAALAQAKKSDAPRLAPDRFKEAERALREAQQKVQAKDYRGALSSATDATERARTAVKAAAAAITMARGAVEVAQAEVQAKFDDVDAVRQEATEAKVPDEAFAELSATTDALKQQADGLLAAASEDVLAAQEAAEALKVQAADLPARYRAALERWQAEHPARKPRPARKR